MLLSLPTELLDAIIERVYRKADKFSLTQTCSSLSGVATRHLYLHNAEFEECSALIWAAKHGLDAVISRYFGDSKMLDRPTDAVREALRAATSAGHTSIVKLLLDSGALEACHSGFVENAVAAGHLDIVKWYLERSSVYESHRSNECSLLLTASMAGHVQVVRYLFRVGLATLTPTLYDGYTPLHAAVYHGHAEIMTFLIENGVDITAVGRRRHTALVVSVMKGYVHIARLLLDYERKLGIVSPDKREAWFCAVQRGNVEMVELLLHHKQAGLSSAEDGHCPLLVRALSCDRPERGAIAHLLISAGADVNAGSIEGHTPIMAAAGTGDSAILLRLLELGADVNHISKSGDCALSWASKEGHVEAVKLLLDHGADPKPAVSGDKAPLAVATRYPEIVRVLLKKGANTELRDDFQQDTQSSSS